MKIIVSPFCQNREQDTCTRPLSDKVADILANFHLATPGYRDGVIYVPVSPDGFLGQIRTLQEGDTFVGSFKRRQDGEDPRKELRVIGEADDLVAVDAVLYRRDVLLEGGENSDLSADYEVVTFLTKITNDPQPMPPETLMANHFHSISENSGGTDTQMDDAQFVAALKRSYEFWKNRAIIQ